MTESINRNLQAAQFVERTLSGGGASMGAHTSRLSEPGTHGFFVGKQPDKDGDPIPTQYVAKKDLTPEVVESARQRVSSAAPDENTHLGSWVDNNHGPDAKVEIDASGKYDRMDEALSTARSRGEKAIWNNRLMREIRTRPRMMGSRKGYSLRGHQDGFGQS